ncbi:thiol peroxidase [Alkalibacterium psychrotolerans]
MDVTLKGEQFQTNGQPPQVGEEAPSFSALDLNGETVKLSDYTGDVVILSTFPDIETSTCSRQTDTFNEKAKELKNTKIISLSANTVDQQKQWCESKVMASELLHDEDRSFSKEYGLYIEDLDKIARAVFVLNRNGQIVYREIVKEMSNNPDFESALSAARHEEAELN